MYDVNKANKSEYYPDEYFGLRNNFFDAEVDRKR